MNDTPTPDSSSAGAPAAPRRAARKRFFHRHRVLTMVLFVGTVILLLDIVAANVLKLIPKRDLYDLSDEKLYRIGDPVYHHGLKANFSSDKALWGRTFYHIRTNSLGMKDSAVRDVPLTTDRTRVVFIGDSFTEGLACDWDETFVGRCAAAWKPRGIEVLNAASSSFAPSIYVARINDLWNRGLRFDELIVCIDLSDIEDDARFYELDPKTLIVHGTNEWDKDAARRQNGGAQAAPPATPENNGDPRGTGRIVVAGDGDGDDAGRAGPPADHSIKGLIKSNTILTAGLLTTLRDLVVSKADEPPPVRTDNYRAKWTYDDKTFDAYGRKGLDKATEHMDLLADMMQERGVRLTIVVYPWPDQIKRKELDSRQVTHWRDWAGRRNVGFINVFPAFIEGQTADDVLRSDFIPWDVHWNAKGHARVAEALLKAYEPRGGQ